MNKIAHRLALYTLIEISVRCLKHSIMYSFRVYFQCEMVSVLPLKELPFPNLSIEIQWTLEVVHPYAAKVFEILEISGRFSKLNFFKWKIPSYISQINIAFINYFFPRLTVISINHTRKIF